MDLGTGLALLGTKDLILKVFGPTADYVGDGLKDFVREKGEKNFVKILQSALKKGASSPGAKVPPRIMKEIFSEGPFIEDELHQEYFGGALATSSSGISRDDRGKSYLDMIKTLSAYEIRTHYLIYSFIRNLFRDSEFKISEKSGEMKIFVPFESYEEGMDFVEGELAERVMVDSILGLGRQGLMVASAWGSKDFLTKRYSGVDSDGFVVAPTQFGAKIFLISHGIKSYENEIVSSSLQLEPLQNIKISNLPKRIS